MTRQIKTADAIREAIRQVLINDESLHEPRGAIPYFCIESLPPGIRQAGANWSVQPSDSGSPEMLAAIQRAILLIQQETDMEVPFLGASASALA